MSVTMSEQTVESVIRKLTFHEALIEKMFTFSSFDASAKRASIERKILALEAVILEIPSDGEEYTTNLFNAWCETVPKLWHRLFLLSDDENRNSLVVSGKSAVDGQAATSSGSLSQAEDAISVPVPSSAVRTRARQTTRSKSSRRSVGIAGSDTVAGPKAGMPSPKKPSKPQAQQQVEENRNDGEEQGEDAGGHESAPTETAAAAVLNKEKSKRRNRKTPPPPKEPESEAEIEAKKESVRAELEATFAGVDAVPDLSSLGAVQAVLTLIAKSAAIMAPFRTDTSLQETVVGYALPKVPQQVTGRYAARVEAKSEASLRVLKRAIIDELAVYYAELKEKAATATALSSEVTANGDGALADDESSGVLSVVPSSSLSSAEKTCYYCKATGHLSFQCEQARLMTCFRCFRTGHKAKDCRRRCYRCNRVGHVKKDCAARFGRNLRRGRTAASKGGRPGEATVEAEDLEGESTNGNASSQVSAEE